MNTTSGGNSLSRRSIFGALAAAASLGLTACAGPDPLARQAAAGDNKNYIAGDGSVQEYAEESRSAPVAFESNLYDGTPVRSTDWSGAVTVLNFWYAACAPCRVEAPHLESLHQEFAPQGVKFYGINVRDEKPTAEAFERTFGITYPSLQDKDGKVLLAMTRFVPPQAVPTTLVLDKRRRVAARILGGLDKSTLKALIASTLKT
ncbi:MULTISPECIES: TlpA disulfide reductase family protein [unclassified Paenarthrobacter]|uniref:TlpA family protein disulfide reductase n=1 Tax=unclassified Paenarthrobacter TaxID=2634190 RepID=UPI00084E9C51|nr:TlpA disulfide reductase family protein [Paenarthrobacter sp. R1]NKR10637.1 thiol-disulfide isomerase [Arthrobacter sp. M5]NKR16478.1 thiol-disulfide isomerase [Arthrobacter sp. M6]OEH61414.1 thiol-disulfide isomerase [Arthrobacter sp. D4]OEH64400.1 thiol-disulfide isomerase [Arthrobacter sp. D2]WIV29180.1 TlpA disulfide reductase family protein [Paenarthrobacter sp. R1]